jgi:hypothetical protein
MNIPDVLLTAMTAAVLATATFILASESKPVLVQAIRRLRQRGDTSIGPRAHHWLAALSVGGALLIGSIAR